MNNINLDEIYEQCYYETLYKHITSEPPRFEMLIDLLKNIKHKFCFILKKDSDLSIEIQERLDEQYVKQMLYNNSFDDEDFYNLALYIFTKCKELCAPQRDSSIDFMIASLHSSCKNNINMEIIQFVKNVNTCLEWLYMDLRLFLNETK